MTGKLLVDEDKATHATRTLNRIPKLTLLGSLDAQTGIGGVSHFLEANLSQQQLTDPIAVAELRRCAEP